MKKPPETSESLPVDGEPGMLRIRLIRPGALACGPYQAGVTYEVEAEEARRLVEAKGFVLEEGPGAGVQGPGRKIPPPPPALTPDP